MLHALSYADTDAKSLSNKTTLLGPATITAEQDSSWFVEQVLDAHTVSRDIGDMKGSIVKSDYSSTK